MTHTPASGPFGPVTTPPISSASMATCAIDGAGATASNAATANAAVLKYNDRLMLIWFAPLVRSLRPSVLYPRIGFLASVPVTLEVVSNANRPGRLHSRRLHKPSTYP